MEPFVTDLNPHGQQMADESMIRTLAAQTEAIWPQEVEIIKRYGLSGNLRILDGGCGTGEASSRLAALFPQASVLGVDIIDNSLEIARTRYPSLAPRLAFERRSLFELGLEDNAFDLTACRHVLHSIPHAARVIAELVRVTRPGGRLHLIPEDYDMIHFQSGTRDLRTFWHDIPAKFGAATGTDLYVGRNTVSILLELGLEEIKVDYVIVDTLRVPREVFATIMTAWRDGYAEPTAQVANMTTAEAIAHFDQMIANIHDPRGYAVWMVPVLSARKP